MSRNKPFTTIAAIVFLLMALAHLYRIAVGFDVTVGATENASPSTLRTIAIP